LIDKVQIFEEGFLTWCQDNNLDPFYKKHGIGLLAIGKAEIIDIENLTKDSKANIIIERK